MNAGTLTLNNSTAAGTGAITVKDATTLQLGTPSSIFVGNNVTISSLNANVSLTSANAADAFGGAFTGSADQTLTISSAGGQQINVNQVTKQFQNVSGTMAVTGTLRFSSSALGATGNSNGGDNAFFNVTGFMTTRNEASVSLGALTGNGTLTAGSTIGNAGLPEYQPVVTYTIGARGTDATFSGAITDAASVNKVSVVKTGSGTQTLSGIDTYTGPTSVTGGTLDLAGSINGTTSVSVASGHLLLSGASEAINNAATLSLSAGATFGFKTGLSGRTETLNSLTLLNNATLDLGDGNTNQFGFANGVSGLGTFTLNIYNWSGPVGDSAQDVLALGITLSATELGKISFYSDAGTAGGFLGTGSEIAFAGPGPSFQIVPVPEPSSTAMIGAAGLLGLMSFRKRRRSFASGQRNMIRRKTRA